MAGLVRDTKTILLHGGMQDSVDDFLIEAPNMELVENGVHDKDGVISKRRGFDALPTIAPSTTVVGGPSLVAVGDSSVQVYDEAVGEWSSVSANTVLGTSDLKFSTEFLPGASAFSVVQVSDRFIIAYQTRKDSPRELPAEDPGHDVYVEVWTGTGARIKRHRFEGYRDPRLSQAPSDKCMLVMLKSLTTGAYVDGTQADAYAVRVNPETLAATAPQSLGFAVDPLGGDYEFAKAALQGTSYAGAFGESAVEEPLFSKFGRYYGNYAVGTDGTKHYVVYESLSRIRIASFSMNSGAPLVTVGLPITSTSTTTKYRVLDLHVTAGSKAYLLLSKEEPNVSGANNELASSVSVYALSKFTLGVTDSGSVWSVINTNLFKDSTDIAGAYVHLDVPVVAVCGSVCVVGTSFYVAFSTLAWRTAYGAGGAVSQTGFNLTGQYPTTYLYEGTVSSLLSDKEVTMSGWRLGSQLSGNADGVSLCMSQWDIVQAGSAGYTGSADHYTCPGLQSPYTNVLCKYTSEAARLTPLAVLGANRTLVVPPEVSAYASHLPTLSSTDAGVLVVTPVISQAAQVTIPGNGDAEQVIITAGTFRAEVSEVSLGTGVPAVYTSDGVLLCSNIPLYFDGGGIGEMAPLTTPIIMGAGVFEDPHTIGLAIDCSPPADLAEVFALKAVASYTDRQGNIHRSAPSRVVYVVKGALNDASNAPEHGAGYLSPTVKLALTTPLTCLDEEGTYLYEVFLLDGATYRLAASVPIDLSDSSGPVLCDVAISDETAPSDQYVRFGKILYTEGGVLPSDVVPSCTTFALGGDRLVGVTDDPLATFVYSKPLTTGIAPEFPNAYYLPLGVGVSVVAIAAMDDKYVLFGLDSIRVIYGQGPSATGQGSGFAVLKLPANVGCLDAQSVVEIPNGVMFRSRAGFYVLGRDLGLTPVFGANDFLTGSRVVAATNVPKSSEVRFLLAADGGPLDSDGPTPDSTRPATPKYGNAYRSGIALCYSYDANKWSTFSNYTGIASTLLNGEYVRLKNSTTVWKEADHWADPTGDNLLKLITPWIKLRSIQDYGQLWKATLLGRYLSTFVEDEAGDLDAGDIQVKVAYDYANTDVDTKLWRASNELQPVERDSAVVSPGALRLQVRPERQKCSSVRFTIEEKNTADADGLTYRPGQGFEITSIDLELGMRPGTNTALPAKSKK